MLLAMKTTTLIILALLTVGCSTWTPTKTVTLRDVEPQLAETEGADLRYLSVPPPQCKGERGCRNTTSSAKFTVYQWTPLCDGAYCGANELAYVDVAREAAHLAFVAEQLVAAQTLLRRDDLSADERLRYEEFVQRTHASLPQKIEATVLTFNQLAQPDELMVEQRDRALAEVAKARDYLQRARTLLGEAAPELDGPRHAWK